MFLLICLIVVQALTVQNGTKRCLYQFLTNISYCKTLMFPNAFLLPILLRIRDKILRQHWSLCEAVNIERGMPWRHVFHKRVTGVVPVLLAFNPQSSLQCAPVTIELNLSWVPLQELSQMMYLRPFLNRKIDCCLCQQMQET